MSWMKQVAIDRANGKYYEIEDYEAAREGRNGTHSVEAQAYLRQFRAESERIRKVFENSTPPPVPPSRLFRWLKSLWTP